MPDKVFDFDNEINELGQSISNLQDLSCRVEKKSSEAHSLLGEITAQINTMPKSLRAVIPPIDIPELEQLNATIDDLSDAELAGRIHLSVLDVTVCIAAGVIAGIIDIILVGTPEVVKLWKGGENFDGSILTGFLRKIGNGDSKLSTMFKWLSEKCQVPYDVSNKKDVVYPNNHRLRNPGHDPLLGLLFAAADIILGTATVIDNNGKIRILVNSKDYPPIQKYLSVLFYLGHLLSDICTARGLPIPGFFLTQFLTKGEDSIAKIAEKMYKDGYDLRHFASMSTPVFVKNLILEGYIRLTRAERDNPDIAPIAVREILKKKETAYKYRLRMVSDAVACGGNVLKFFILPTKGNITALNIPDWSALLKNTIVSLKYQMREKSIEKVIAYRQIIDDNWEYLALQEINKTGSILGG